MNRDFKGIWIPREIWLRNDISCQERCLWAEIHSLFDREKGGCYASNQYLMDFVGVKERMLQIMISNLKAKGLLVEVSFNGRVRVIKAVLPPEDFSPCGAEVQYIAGQGCNKMHLSGAENCTPLIYRDKSLEKSIEHTQSQAPDSAIAEPPIVGSVGISSSSKPKAKKEAPEFSPQVREVSTQMLGLLTEHHPVYRPPEDLTKFMNQVRMMLEDDKQKAEDILETFAWAAADNIKRDTFNGWQSVICRNKRKGKVSNPAEIFREHFSMIHSQMNSRIDRKFAPSSNDKRAVEIMQEMKKRAL